MITHDLVFDRFRDFCCIKDTKMETWKKKRSIQLDEKVHLKLIAKGR
jgi:hypothetical protein